MVVGRLLNFVLSSESSHDRAHEVCGDWWSGFSRRGWFSAWSAEGGVILSHVDLERYFSQSHGGRQLFVRDSVD